MDIYIYLNYKEFSMSHKDEHCCKSNEEDSLYAVGINDLVPSFTADIYNPVKGEIEKLEFKKGKWTILFFYPADFTFVCPTELADLAQKQETLKAMGVDVYGISTDSAYSHLVWLRSEAVLKDIKFPMISDIKKEISEIFGLLNYESGMALRGTVVINPDGKFVSSEIVPNGVGRNADELVRKMEAMKFNYENPNIVCPAKWQKGDKGLEVGKLVVGDISKTK
jgi:alkyl hydroperoxide reductase subunit AhpC